MALLMALLSMVFPSPTAPNVRTFDWSAVAARGRRSPGAAPAYPGHVIGTVLLKRIPSGWSSGSFRPSFAEKKIGPGFTQILGVLKAVTFPLASEVVLKF